MATDHSPITPYVAAQVATKLLGRPVSEQTMFNLARNKKIATTVVEGSSAIHFDGNAFARWLKQRKNNPARTHVDYASYLQEFGEDLEEVEPDPYKY